MPSPRSRRALIALRSVSLSALVAGCLGGGSGLSDAGTSTDATTADGRSIAEPFDCENASWPAPDVAAGVEREFTVDGEARTETSDGDAVVACAAAYEEAHRRNDLAADEGETWSDSGSVRTVRNRVTVGAASRSSASGTRITRTSFGRTGSSTPTRRSTPRRTR
jgi:hypothetical protein